MASRVNGRRSAEERFASLSASLLDGDPCVSEGRMFGSQGLKVGGKVFAMLVKGQLVVKLPAERVNKLVEDGAGNRFDPGHGRLLKGWVAIPPGAGVDWHALAIEASNCVSRSSPRAAEDRSSRERSRLASATGSQDWPAQEDE
jgi:hypothetical protein